MLLTLKPSSQNGVKGPPHDYAIVRQSIPAAPRSSPPPAVSEPQIQQSMESSRRGLPPPSALTLPPPDVAFAAANPMNQQHQPPLPPPPPPPPPQRQDSDASYHSWLEAKAEEDRRKQEEEKTRQETLRLEQRRIEQSMLRDSLHAGVPPHMIPLIFAGISQGGVPQSVLEVTQQYMTQSAIPPPRGPPAAPSMPGPSHSSSQRRAPHVRRDSRSIPSSSTSSSHPYVASTQQPVAGPGVLLSQPLHASAPSSTPPSLGRSLDPRAAPSMSRHHPGESQSSHQQPAINLSNVHYAPGSSVPLSQPAAGKSDSQPRPSPPSLYFHHWVPPAQSLPNTPSGRNRQESPGTSQAPLPRRADYQSSPGRKRKAPGPHQQAPLPSSRPSDNLPGSSQNSRSGSPMTARPAEQSSHTRKRSDASNGYDVRMTDHQGPESTSRRASLTRPTIRTRTSAEETGSERGYSRTEDQDRSEYPSRSESHVNYSHRASQGPYASGAGTAPPDSDADSSPGHSPRTGSSRRLMRSDASPRGQ
ncbi:hypothetical protein N8T08_002493 [Aspergillus melleus]|uniref:Uncharacterized protein n=1 Tax=Aspergillus melleus TaxID=138277 RepID=A0ACC3ALT3_9EURO|nr:hypothetical protein N8T08_002493 [Aspergillus melleus]